MSTIQAKKAASKVHPAYAWTLLSPWVQINPNWTVLALINEAELDPINGTVFNFTHRNQGRIQDFF